MANQLREIAGTLLLLKKEDIGSKSSFLENMADVKERVSE